VVGDDDQSIYGWRGADVERILRFEQDFEGAHVVRLETNYRSTSEILDAANRVIAHNLGRHAKTLRSAVGPGEPVRLRTCEDDAAEALATAREIQELVRRREARFADVAILFRTGTQPRVFETHLRMCAIPYVLVGGPSFFDRREVRDVLAYLRLLANPRDEASFLRVVNVPPRGIGKTTLERAIGQASRAGVPVAELFASGAEIEDLTPQAREAVADFGRLLATLRSRVPAIGPARLVEEVLEATGYRGEVERRYPDPAAFRERWSGVLDIVHAAAEHERRAQGKRAAGLDRFLQELALSADDDATGEDPGSRDAVTLMTLHAAKGLEFPRVYLVGLEEGLLPHARAAAEDGVEEERRLCYVGITRAQRFLVLSTCTSRQRGQSRVPAHPSRFLLELQNKRPPPGWVPAGRKEPAVPGPSKAAGGRARARRGSRKAPKRGRGS
jgi:DNA helicase-2/ATP-dependent DNA helicase PcrA